MPLPHHVTLDFLLNLYSPSEGKEETEGRKVGVEGGKAEAGGRD